MEININVGEQLNECFVVMPFNEIFDTQYRKVIKPAIESCGIGCTRGDEIYSNQRIMDDIWNSLRKCKLVIAELTGKNPNVLYEIGLAHALGKPIITITRNKEDVPFDLRDLRYIYYDTQDPFWGENLKIAIEDQIKRVIKDPKIGKYLDGIEIPNIAKLKKVKIENSEYDKFSLYIGNWKADYLNKNSPGLQKAQSITLSIKEEDNRLNAVSTSILKQDELESIFVEIYNSKFEDDHLILQGVNFSTIKNEITNAVFDHNKMVLITENGLLKGQIIDQSTKHKMSVVFSPLKSS